MKALTLWQPWASFLVAGLKEYETRGWPTEHRGPLLIHAAAKEPVSVHAIFAEHPARRALLTELFGAFGYVGGASWNAMPRGYLLGVVHVRDCIGVSSPKGPQLVDLPESELLLGDWTAGRFAWRCTSPVRFRKPIKAKGRQGLWEYAGALKEWGA